MIYNFIVARIKERLARELIESIPEKVRNPGLRLFADDKKRVERMLMYMAYELHKRMMYDSRHTEIYIGQLAQIKLLMMMIETKIREDAPKEERKESSFDKAMEGVKEFFHRAKHLTSKE